MREALTVRRHPTAMPRVRSRRVTLVCAALVGGALLAALPGAESLAALGVGTHDHRMFFYGKPHAVQADDYVGVRIIAGKTVICKNGKYF